MTEEHHKPQELETLGLTEEVVVKSEGVLFCRNCQKALTVNEAEFKSAWAYCNTCFKFIFPNDENEDKKREIKDKVDSAYTKPENVLKPSEFKPEPLQVKDIKEDIPKLTSTIPIHQRLEQVGIQKGLFGEDIALTQFKNLAEKRALKEKVKALFGGEMIRSIITPKDIDGNKRLDKLERQDQRDSGSNNSTIERADKFGKKTMDTLSTFPELITSSYTALLSKEGDKVYDAFSGHNSRATGVLAMGRKYYSYDIHTFPVNFTIESCKKAGFKDEDYEINLGSSEKAKYENESMDFSITCPPYSDVEKYSEIYGENKIGDLSNSDYEDFLPIYKKCLSETYRVLKYGSYFVIVVGDIHRAGEYTSLMLDTIKIGKELGFKLHDLNIYNRKSNIGGDMNYPMFINKCRRFPTIHEFIIIFKK
jgi:DNA modification methylase